jgi:hypothetical protein
MRADAITLSDPFDSESDDAEIVSELDSEASDVSMDYILSDANNLPPGIFPCQLKYMDLSFLLMKSKIRIPETVMIRNEWLHVTDIINNRRKGIEGSVLITGQPGIGKN